LFFQKTLSSLNYLFSYGEKVRFYNILIGWLVFVVAAITYLLTIETHRKFMGLRGIYRFIFQIAGRSSSGAPLFMIVARFFSLFAGADHSKASIDD